jgi:acyl carrier protein
MTATRSDVAATISAFLTRINKAAEFSADTPLYADGIGLDSLETAELSALLEDEHGDDPFSTGATMPETVGDILGFYHAVPGDA